MTNTPNIMPNRRGPSLVTVGACLLLAACGGGGATPAASGNPATNATSATSTPATPTGGTSATSSCVDTSLGVCTIRDAGITHIPLSRAGANGLAVDARSGLVYVVINGETGVWCGGTQKYPEGLSIVDPAQLRETALVATGPGPVWPLVDQRRNKVYVAASGAAGTVVVHTPVTGAIERSFKVGGRPHDLGLDPAGSLMLVSNTFDKSQTFISLLNVDTGVVQANIQVPELPHKVAVDELNRVAYTVSLGAGGITAVDLATGTKRGSLSSGSIPQTSAMVYSP